MSLIKILFSTIVEALFPLSQAEKELLTYTPRDAYEMLPKSPKVADSFTQAVFAYGDERVQKLIWNIKYKKSIHAVSIGAYALLERLRAMNLPTSTIIIPIPITPKRRRERGYNQCELIVDEIRALDTSHIFHYRNDLLLRTHHSSRQTLKDRAHRLESAKGIFSLHKKVFEVPTDTTIIIIDDVITTGSTMQEALETFKEAGFQKVTGIALAH
jgi:competence protein ComFC